MSYELSFSDEFFAPAELDTGMAIPLTEHPTTLIEAIAVLDRDDYSEACKEAGIHPDSESAEWELLDYAKNEVCTCDSIARGPIRVYLTRDYSIWATVYSADDCDDDCDD